MVDFSDPDEVYKRPDQGPAKRPLFGVKLPVGKRVGEILAGQRRPKAEEEEVAKRESDIWNTIQAIGQEIRAIRDALLRAGIIDASGMPTKEGQGPGNEFSFFGNWQGGGGGPGGVFPPPWWPQFMATLRKYQKIIELLMENKEFGEGAAHMAGQTMQLANGFHKGKFYGSYILDALSAATMSLPGTIDTGVLPAAAKFWQNRLFADLNNHRVYVATAPGDNENFFTVGEVVWKYDATANKIELDDPQGLSPVVSFAAAATLSVPAALFSGMLKVDAAGNLQKTTGGLGVAGQILLSGTDWSNPVLQDNLFAIKNSVAPTKRVNFSATNITAGSTRTITMPDRNFQQAEHAYIGAAAPTVSEGQPWYKTADDCQYVYEATRTKWLSTTEYSSTMFTHTGAAAAGVPLQLPQGIVCGGANPTGEWMLWAGTMTGAWFAAKANVGGNRTFTVYKNGVITAAVLTMLNGTRFISNTAGNVDFAAGDYISIVVGAGGVNQPHGKIFYRRRTT